MMMKQTKVFVMMGIYLLLQGCFLSANVTDLSAHAINFDDQIPTYSKNTEFHLSGNCAKCNGYLFKVGVKELTDCNITEDVNISTHPLSFDISDLPDGPIRLCVWGTKNDQILTDLKIYEWIKDVISPSLIGSLISGNGFYRSIVQSPPLSWPLASDLMSGIDHYEIAIGSASAASDIVAWKNIGADNLYTLTDLSLASGQTYYPSVRAVDKAGNVSMPLIGSGWYVDPVIPQSIASFNDMNFGGQSETPMMTWSAALDLESGVHHYQMALGSAPGLTDVLGFSNVISPSSPTDPWGKLTGLNLTNGQMYYPSLRAIDNADNPSTISQGNGFRSVSTWQIQTGANIAGGDLKSTATQSDGKIVMGGCFTNVSESISYAVGALNANGTLNTNFQIGSGFRRTNGTNGSVSELKIQSDGKIVAIGDFAKYRNTVVNNIVRINGDGSQDFTFKMGTGFVGGILRTIQLQTDGKILVAGNFTNYNGTNIRNIIRLNSDGGMDLTFNPGISSDYDINSVYIEDNGKIIIGGGFTSFNGTTVNGIARLNADGSLDVTFNQSGSGFSSSSIYTISKQSTGKIIISGIFSSYNGTNLSNIVRLNNDGSLDTSFNPSGSGFDGQVNHHLVLPDDKIIVGGVFINYNGILNSYLVKLNSDGSVDSSFNNGGSGPNYHVYDFKHLSNGKIILLGNYNSYNGISVKSIMKLNSDGTIDGTFSNSIDNIGGSKVYMDQTENLWIAGFSYSYSKNQNGIVRIDENGYIDKSFNVGTGFGFGYSFYCVNKILIQPDGKILAGGYYSGYNGTAHSHLARINSDGSVDPSFNLTHNFIGEIMAMGLQADGKIIIAGDGFNNDLHSDLGGILRLNSDGSIDSSFITGSGFYTDSPDTINGARIDQIIILNDGSILVGGGFDSYNNVLQSSQLIKLNSDGTQDMSFTPPPYYGIIYYQKVNGGNQDKIYINGSAALMRYNYDLSIDSSFSHSSTFTGGGFALQSDGKIILGLKTITRLNIDGSIDTSFNAGANFKKGLGSSNGTVIKAISILPDGRILVGGNLQKYDNLSIGNAVILGW